MYIDVYLDIERQAVVLSLSTHPDVYTYYK